MEMWKMYQHEKTINDDDGQNGKMILERKIDTEKYFLSNRKNINKKC